MTDIKLLELDKNRTMWLHLCVKNNKGFFYSDAQKMHLLDYVCAADVGPDSDILLHRFPKATWYVKYDFTVPATKVVMHLMLVGDDVGVLAKLKLSKRKELEVALDNGYLVTWERAAGHAMNDQAYALVKDALTHMTKADKLLNSNRTRVKTLESQLLLMHRWKRRVDFLKGGSQQIVIDADVSDLMTDYTDRVFARVIEIHNANLPLIPMTHCQLCEWLDRNTLVT